ncbi:MAG: hypothetical protein AB7K09_17330 [Planctomycetota bacterium]
MVITPLLHTRRPIALLAIVAIICAAVGWLGMQPAAPPDPPAVLEAEDHDGQPLIRLGEPGEWDESIREIGNVIEDASDPRPDHRFKAFYSGYCGPYRNTNVFIGYAHSADGREWIKGPRAHNHPAEDPYVVQHNGRWFMFYENKADVPFRNIHLAVSDDACETWQLAGHNPVLGPVRGGQPTDWEADDVSSPVVWIDENDTWHMLYEGRGGSLYGRIGHAVSADGLTWVRTARAPVFGPGEPGEWDDANVVPDDVIIVGDVLFLLYHGCNNEAGAPFEVGAATTRDLRHWVRCGCNPIATWTDTAMLLPSSEPSLILLGRGGITRFGITTGPDRRR